jgi:putative transposase
VLRPSTKAVDAALLLARAVTPEPMRPGWPDALAMSRSVLPYRGLLSVDERMAHAAARPVIVPETIVCDHGKAFLSQAFRSACRALGVTVQPAHPNTPTDKPVVERTLGSVATLFAQHVRGYVGSSVERRGANAEQDAAWPMAALQDLLDEWIVACWQNRPHDGLRDPLTPGRALSPNEKYAALVEIAGYVPVALSPHDYIELLPVTWRVINSYGVKINHRVYDSAALNPCRRQDSGVRARKALWEVRYDPYDISRIWIRNHHHNGPGERQHDRQGDPGSQNSRDGEWITAVWTHLRAAPMPFGEQAWEQARKVLARRGQDPVTEHEIAQAARELLDRAERGPADSTTNDATTNRTITNGSRHRMEGGERAGQRVAGRTRATSAATWPRPVHTSEPEPADAPELVEPAELVEPVEPAEVAPLPEVGAFAGVNKQNEEPDAPGLAKVIPLPVFDAREEAEKWW